MEINYSYYATSKGYKVVGGTAAQFLKADGSVDSNSYLSTGGANYYIGWDGFQNYFFRDGVNQGYLWHSGNLNPDNYIPTSLQSSLMTTNTIQNVSAFKTFRNALEVRGGNVNSNTTKLHIGNDSASVSWALSAGNNYQTEENFYIGRWDGNTFTAGFSIDNNFTIGTNSNGNSAQWYEAWTYGNHANAGYTKLPYQWNFVGSQALTDRTVIGEMIWRAYGNGHTIFDVSGGVTPWGASVSNVDSQQPWTPNYPTLVGGNGAGTYGVRVDSARNADNLGGTSAGSYVLQSNLNSQLIGYAALNAVQTFNQTNTFAQSPIVPNGTLPVHATNLQQLKEYVPGAKLKRSYFYNGPAYNQTVVTRIYLPQYTVSDLLIRVNSSYHAGYAIGMIELHLVYGANEGSWGWNMQFGKVFGSTPGWFYIHPTIHWDGVKNRNYINVHKFVAATNPTYIEVEIRNNSNNLTDDSVFFEDDFTTPILDLRNQSYVDETFIPKTHPVNSVTAQEITDWNFISLNGVTQNSLNTQLAPLALKDGSNATDNWVNSANGLKNNPTILGKMGNGAGQSDLINAIYGQVAGYINTSGTGQGNPTNDWWFRIKMLHNNQGGYYGEIAVQMTGGNSLRYKRHEAGTSDGFITVWDDHNFNPASKVNALENATAVGFTNGNSNDAPYIYHTTDGYRFLATQTWVTQLGYLTAASLNGYATQAWVQSLGYLTSSSLIGYATQSFVSTNFISQNHPVNSITQTNINFWNNIASYAHQHSNFSTLENINQELATNSEVNFARVIVEDYVKAQNNFMSANEDPNTIFIPDGNTANIKDEIINEDYVIRLNPHEYNVDSTGYCEVNDRNRLIHVIGEQIKMAVNFKEIYPKQEIVIYNFDQGGNTMAVQVQGQTRYDINPGNFLRIYVTESLRVIAERQQQCDFIW